MKQRITVEQLNELTDEQKERLREWWKPQTGDWCYPVNDEGYSDYCDHGIVIGDVVHDFPHGDFSPISYYSCLPLLSIGQMIELTESTNIIKYNGGWALEEDAISFHDELCDALWEAVKNIL